MHIGMSFYIEMHKIYRSGDWKYAIFSHTAGRNMPLYSYDQCFVKKHAMIKYEIFVII